MRQVLINNSWESPPSGDNIESWLTEVVAVELNMVLLIPKRYIPRFELIIAIRESPRHKVIPVKVFRSLNKNKIERIE